MHVQNGLKMAQNAKNGFIWVAILTNLATLKFSKVVYDIKLTFLYNLYLVLGQYLLPSWRRCRYKMALKKPKKSQKWHILSGNPDQPGDPEIF